jgi:hypothetical protein
VSLVVLESSVNVAVVYNALSAYFVWFVLVLGAARGQEQAAIAIAVAIIATNLLLQASWWRSGVYVVAIAALGSLIDTVLIHCHVYTPAGYAGWFCPPWITLLWANFATTLRASLQWLLARPVFAALLGSVAGPLSYGAAARLGAAVIHEPATFQYAVLAIVWAGTMAFLAAVSCWSVATLARRSVAAGALLLPAVLLATAVRKVEVAGVTFPLSVEAQGIQLRLVGAGVLRYRVVFKGYAAALYLGDSTPPERVLDDVPKRLEIHYFWAIPAEAFGEAADAILARNVPGEELARLRDRVQQLHRSYEAVQPGDRYSLTYVPGYGTELALNGVVKARIPGADFARAYFSIWLGPQPISDDLKQALLGQP